MYRLRSTVPVIIELTSLLPIIGMYLLMLAVAMLPPALIGYVYDEANWYEFLVSFAVTAVSGFFFTRIAKDPHFGYRIRSIFLLTSLVWVFVAIFATLPFLLIEHISFTNAFFETVSGITTTGSTVLSGLDTHEHSILLWRSLLQWLGGIGFVVTGIALLPFLNVGGMRLFRSESSDWSEHLTPRIGNLAREIMALYLSLSLLCMLAYYWSGMTPFEAINHAMATISTGGFSTSDQSLGYFSPAAHWVACFFMLVGGLPFMLIIQSWRTRSARVFLDAQVRGYFAFLALAIAGLTLWLYLHSSYDFLDSLRLSSVNVISVVTTTGFAVTDYSAWGTFALLSFFFLTLVGGCSGSTAGGVKIFRFQLAGIFLRQEMLKLVHPNAVVRWKYNGKAVNADVIRSLIAFSWAFLLTIMLITLLLALGGLDKITSLSAAMTAVANVGPGLGDIIGPAGNFAPLHDFHKWVLSIGMLLGRLEVLTVLVILFPAFWRR